MTATLKSAGQIPSPPLQAESTDLLSRIRTHSHGQSRNENKLSTVPTATKTLPAEVNYQLLTAGAVRPRPDH